MVPKGWFEHYKRKGWKQDWSWLLRYGIWSGIKGLPRSIKHFCQRGWRGWADCDTWSLDYYLNSWMPDAVRHLRDNNHGSPAAEGMTPEKWHAILTKIADGFEAASTLESQPWLDAYGGYDENFFEWYKDNEEDIEFEIKRLTKIKDEGMALFVEWYDGLWD